VALGSCPIIQSSSLSPGVPHPDCASPHRPPQIAYVQPAAYKYQAPTLTPNQFSSRDRFLPHRVCASNFERSFAPRKNISSRVSFGRTKSVRPYRRTNALNAESPPTSKKSDKEWQPEPDKSTQPSFTCTQLLLSSTSPLASIFIIIKSPSLSLLLFLDPFLNFFRTLDSPRHYYLGQREYYSHQIRHDNAASAS